MRYPSVIQMLKDYYGETFRPEAPLPQDMSQDLWFYRSYLRELLSGEGKFNGIYCSGLGTLFDSDLFCIYTVEFLCPESDSEVISPQQYYFCHVWSCAYEAMAASRLACKFVLMEQHLFCIVNPHHQEVPDVEAAESFLAEAADIAATLAQWFRDSYQIHTCVSFSSPYFHIRHIEKAYYEASALAEFCRLVSVRDRVTRFSDHALPKNTLSLNIWLIDAERRYLSALFARQYPAARDILLEILRQQLSTVMAGIHIKTYLTEKLSLALDIFGQSAPCQLSPCGT